ncbi:MAG: ATPase, partial [Bacteroidetes bacterium]
GLHDLKLAVDTMKILKKDIGVIINRFGIGDAKVEKYCKKNDIPIIAKIPNMRKIAELYSDGNLLYPKLPEVKIQLENIITFISEHRLEVTQ